MRSLANALEKIQTIAGAIAISIFLITVIIQIAARFLKVPVMWAQDVSVYSFIWAVFLGAAIAVNGHQHFAFDSLRDHLKGRWKTAHGILIVVLMLIFTIAMSKYGIDVTKRFWNYQWVNIPSFKMGYVWIALPITGITMTFYLITHLFESIYSLIKGGEVS
ncbi:TRAP transporter small permease [Acidaminobacter hydrogenoformans]|uniref:TRAP-type C4-dicarboxylate transport system, small permease component n=1 Tax=Acidaminobacter hydrogenoformans DSM 2784 TaxID=1120920 RepID=A0A1G5RR23_9FIRM|nr:TRAP transporter small permease [Acidaminobacter hydrogenoformans]SCZ76523.1 TRAP-type C4-dicarboxylate transport system, small permease component [Acidaminobacter hydrogenoformans DSM 2784]